MMALQPHHYVHALRPRRNAMTDASMTRRAIDEMFFAKDMPLVRRIQTAPAAVTYVAAPKTE